MKRVILLILCFCLAASLLFSGCALKNDTAKPASKPGSIFDQHDPDGTTETDSGEFDAGMMKYIEKSEKGNYVISPVSLKLVLGMLEAGVPVYAATLSEKSVPLPGISLSGASVVIGNEARGVSEEVRKLSSGEILIPMPGDAESLNAAVAAAILMWEMTKENRA